MARFSTVNESFRALLASVESDIESADLRLDRLHSEQAELKLREAELQSIRLSFANLREKIKKMIAEAEENGMLDKVALSFETAHAIATKEYELALGPMWKIIEHTMRGKESFTMTEAGRAIEGILGRSIGKNRPQTVRNNLVRHPEVFRQNDDASWTVITSEKEVASEKGTS